MPDPAPIRVVLDESTFRDLCTGEVVRCWSSMPPGHRVELVLVDRDVVPMLRAVLDG